MNFEVKGMLLSAVSDSFDSSEGEIKFHYIVLQDQNSRMYRFRATPEAAKEASTHEQLSEVILICEMSPSADKASKIKAIGVK